MEPLLDLVHEDAALLVVNKPAGLACHPTKDGPLSSLISRARLHLGEGATCHLLNRLDRETSGVVLIAKEDDVARELRRLWESRAVRKEYLAIAHGHVREARGTVDAPLGRDESAEVAIKDCVRADGAAARTEFEVVHRFTRERREFTLLRALPVTGRKHQIRIHLAHIGHAIVGDKLYGGDERLYLDFVKRRLTAEQRARLMVENHALHARCVGFEWRECLVEFAAAPSGEFAAFAGHALSPRTGTGPNT
jgi:23S rRNA pseudouridine1911/1915/1917 synthase